MSLEDPENLVTGDALHLRDAVGVTEDDADLRRREPFLRELKDVFLHLREP